MLQDLVARTQEKAFGYLDIIPGDIFWSADGFGYHPRVKARALVLKIEANKYKKLAKCLITTITGMYFVQVIGIHTLSCYSTTKIRKVDKQ